MLLFVLCHPFTCLTFFYDLLSFCFVNSSFHIRGITLYLHRDFLSKYVKRIKDMKFLREDLIFTTHSEEVISFFFCLIDLPISLPPSLFAECKTLISCILCYIWEGEIIQVYCYLFLNVIVCFMSTLYLSYILLWLIVFLLCKF